MVLVASGVGLPASMVATGVAVFGSAVAAKTSIRYEVTVALSVDAVKLTPVGVVVVEGATVTVTAADRVLSPPAS